MATKKATKRAAVIEEKPAKKHADTGGVKVRMYRQGLGDCFLLTIPTGRPRPFYILIDCGVVLGTSNPEAAMTKVVENIAAVTKDGKTSKGVIDLLIATHEHWDHISAFTQVEKLIFEKLEFKEVWLAWTENPKDALANKLRAERRVAENALRLAANHLALAGSESAARVSSLVDFFGARPGSTGAALDNIRKLAKQKPRYRTPGEPPIEFDDAPGVRFWILGPPKDEKLIKKSNPGKNDAYGLDAGSGGAQALLVAALTRDFGMDVAMNVFEDVIEDPFDKQFCIPVSRAQHVPFFASRYFGDSSDDGVYDREADNGGAAIRDQSWRRIDQTWMDGAETMALQLDSATNNTSLAIAIELTDTGQVLLFPGDAQAGNWLSWQKLSWTIEGNGSSKERVVTGPDLLARTVFYKVGHHGSHNATLKAMGLEQMTSEQLVGMIPVDHDMAVKKRWGRMPLPDLVDRLKEKTAGRLLRIDDKTKTPKDLAALKPKTTDAATWDAFARRVDVTELYYELSF